MLGLSPMKRLSILFFFLIFFLFSFSFVSCTCTDSDDDDSGGDDDSSGDDDSPGDDDDNNDTEDDDDDDDDDEDEQLGCYINGLFIEVIDDTVPGSGGTDMVIGPDDTQYIVSANGIILFLYSKGINDSNWSRDKVDCFALNPEIFIDSSGYLHISYADVSNIEEYHLKYATNRGKNWKSEIIDDSSYNGEFSDIAIDSFTFISDGFDIISSFEMDKNEFMHVSSYDLDTNDLWLL